MRLPLCKLSGGLLRPPLHRAGLTASLGASAGVGFAVSHELTHGRTRSDKFMAGLLLCLTYYMHWDNSHQAHHVKVRTAHPSRLGMPSGLPRLLLSSFLSPCSAFLMHCCKACLTLPFKQGCFAAIGTSTA